MIKIDWLIDWLIEKRLNIAGFKASPSAQPYWNGNKEKRAHVEPSNLKRWIILLVRPRRLREAKRGYRNENDAKPILSADYKQSPFCRLVGRTRGEELAREKWPREIFSCLSFLRAWPTKRRKVSKFS